jgi:hypothetical protein
MGFAFIGSISRRSCQDQIPDWIRHKVADDGRLNVDGFHLQPFRDARQSHPAFPALRQGDFRELAEASLTSWWVDGETNRPSQNEAQLMKERSEKLKSTPHPAPF